jgi:hypothetical protein
MTPLLLDMIMTSTDFLFEKQVDILTSACL